LQIYLLQDGEKRGPLSVYDVAEQVRSGKAGRDTLGWCQGSDGWVRLDELPPTSSIFVEPPPRPAVVQAEEMAARRARLGPERMRSSLRLWARLTDLFLVGWLVSMAALVSGLMTVTEIFLDPRIEVALLPAAVQMLLEGFLLHAYGTTPGKWLMRVRVSHADGGRIGLRTSFRRAFTVWWRGIGFWLFPLNLFTMALSQATQLGTGKTPWDHACNLQVACGKVDRNRIFLIVALFFGLVTVMNLAFGEELLAAWEAAKKKK